VPTIAGHIYDFSFQYDIEGFGGAGPLCNTLKATICGTTVFCAVDGCTASAYALFNCAHVVGTGAPMQFVLSGNNEANNNFIGNVSLVDESNQITNGNFETCLGCPSGAGWCTTAAPCGKTPFTGLGFGPTPPGGGFGANFAFCLQAPGTISQSVPTIAGQIYDFSFQYDIEGFGGAGPLCNTLRATICGTPVFCVVDGCTASSYVLFNCAHVVGTGVPIEIVFSGNNEANNNFVGNVSFVTAAPGAPEFDRTAPASGIAAALGVLAIVASRRRPVL
jgi:hypothetical protein